MLYKSSSNNFKLLLLLMRHLCFSSNPRVFVFLLLALGPCLSRSDAKSPLQFEQLGEMLPTPNQMRLASGAPGPAYWQQEANYRIRVELDEIKHSIQGSETVEYINHSPHTLNYIWVQLDQNALAPDSKRQRSTQAPNLEPASGKPAELEYETFREFAYNQKFEGGYTLESVNGVNGNPLDYTVVDTNMPLGARLKR